MRGVLSLGFAGLLAAAVTLTEPAAAQVRIQLQGIGIPLNSQIFVPAMRARITPTDALRKALTLAPQAQPIAVRFKGSFYVVKLRQGNVLMLVRVDATTGEILQ